ncbi:MAG: class F sortase [Candidatus Paceibacterota bacterium]
MDLKFITIKSLLKKKHIPLLVGILTIPVLFTILAVQNTNNTIQTKVSVAVSNQRTPLRIIIPSIDVNATVELAGITDDGKMESPKLPENVSWFTTGPQLGEIGTSVIAGHYGWKNGKASAFDRLHTLIKGDSIEIQDTEGKSYFFVVRETKRYEDTASSTDVFISHDGKSHLNLITCEGMWNAKTKSYQGRLVVFTDELIR